MLILIVNICYLPKTSIGDAYLSLCCHVSILHYKIAVMSLFILAYPT